MESVHSKLRKLEGEVESLRESKEFASALIDKSPNPILVINSDASIRYANRALEELTGLATNEIVGMQPPYLWWTEETLEKTGRDLKNAMRNGAFRMEELFKRKDGSRFWVEITSTSVKKDKRMRYYLANWVDITERKLVEDDLRIYQDRLKSLATQLLLAEEKERRRIATELHDEIGQTLAMINIKLGELRQEKEAEEIAGPLDKVMNLCKKAIQDTRSLTFELSPPVLYELGFEAAVAWLAERYTGEHGIPVGFEDDGAPKSLGEDLRVLMFQSVRELLNNAVRYAKAGEIWVRVGCEGDDIRVEVEDDGVGFDPSELKQKEGFGLFNIHERLSSVGGRFVVRSAPGEGTRVILMVPLKDEDIQ